MNDKELLELAARAYGIKGEYYKKQRMVREFVFVTEEGMIASGRTALSLWNPLTNDGDAFRLAVKLNLVHGKMFSRRVADSHGGAGDIYASTRRAIVLAAAAIGETLP